MCDTLVALPSACTGKQSFFAKNSDREPGEPQMLISLTPKEIASDLPYYETKKAYIDEQYKTLVRLLEKYPAKYTALVSRPVWMWGAEMGINERGIAIGNEAVFSKEKQFLGGPLGMDLLRLAVHHAGSIDEALELLVKIISTEGQGGDGGYTHPLRYHNSFLITDGAAAVILETSGKHWAYKKVKTSGSISNAYSLSDDYDAADRESQPGAEKANFGALYSNNLITHFAKGRDRQKFSACSLADNTGKIQYSKIKSIMRSHITSDDKNPVRGMKSMCVHPGRLVKSQTTASMIVHYVGGKQIIWVTGSPYPCVSLYKPVILTSSGCEQFAASRAQENYQYAADHKQLSHAIEKHHDRFEKEILPLRDEYEQMFEHIVYDKFEKKSAKDLSKDSLKCFELEREYIARVRKIASL